MIKYHWSEKYNLNFLFVEQYVSYTEGLFHKCMKMLAPQQLIYMGEMSLGIGPHFLACKTKVLICQFDIIHS